MAAIGKKAVLESGPNGGKTTILRAMQKLGFRVIEEKATEVIREGRLSPTTNPLEFRREMLERQKAAEIAEGAVIDPRTTILDRGAYTARVFCKATKFPEPRFSSELPKGLYPLVFILAPVPTWHADGVRYEDLDFSYTITPMFKEEYRDTGARVVDVPFMPVQDRVNLILSVLNEHNMNCRS